MTKDEVEKARLLVYMKDGNVDGYKPDEWTKYGIVDNHLEIRKYIGTEWVYMAIYNMDVVEKVVLSL